MPIANPGAGEGPSRVVVISGGTDGMGAALARARMEQGDQVVVIGSSAEKGRRIIADAERIRAERPVHVIRADLSSVAETRRAAAEIRSRHAVVDALCLFANRQSTARVLTRDGLERTFALYYLSRYVLGHELAPLLRSSRSPVIVNVAGVGITKGEVHWDDLQLEHGYGTVTAQLQAGRANDLLGVAYARREDAPARYALYHPGFTRSGDLSPLPAAARALISAAAAFAARPVERSIAPIHELIEDPPAAPLTAIDRGHELPLSLETLDPVRAERLERLTRSLLTDIAARS